VLRIEIVDPSLVVLVGASGAGKTTFAARHFQPEEVLSSDDFRALVAGDPADQRASGLAFRRLHEALARRLDRQQMSVVDATNLAQHARRVLLGRAAETGVSSSAIVLAPPAAVVHARNAARPGRVVPSEVVDAQLRRLDELLASGRLDAEGFAAIHRLDGEVRLDRVTIVRVSR
jgi:protein phosphatase